MQEAFVASLLAIAARGGTDVNDFERDSERWAGPLDPMTLANQQAFIDRVDNEGKDPEVEKLELWIEIQKQVKILKEEMEEEEKSKSSTVAMSSNTGGNDIDVVLRDGKKTVFGYQRLWG